MDEILRMDKILRYPLPIVDGEPIPYIRLDISEETAEDISSLYSHRILILNDDYTVTVNEDIPYNPPIRTGGSIIKMTEHSSQEKEHLAIENSIEDRMNKRFLNCIFTHSYNVFLDIEQRKVYLAKKFPYVLRANNKSPRKILMEFNHKKREFLYQTAREIMVEGMMLDTRDEYGEIRRPQKTKEYALKRIERVDPKNVYQNYLRKDLMLLFTAHPILKDKIPMDLFENFLKIMENFK